MLFGDFPLVLMNGLIASKVISVDKALKKSEAEDIFICQFAFSFLSLFKSFIALESQRTALNED